MPVRWLTRASYAARLIGTDSADPRPAQMKALTSGAAAATARGHDLRGRGARGRVDRDGLARPARRRAGGSADPRSGGARHRGARLPAQPPRSLPRPRQPRRHRHRLPRPVRAVLLGGHPRLRGGVGGRRPQLLILATHDAMATRWTRSSTWRIASTDSLIMGQTIGDDDRRGAPEPRRALRPARPTAGRCRGQRADGEPCRPRAARRASHRPRARSDRLRRRPRRRPRMPQSAGRDSVDAHRRRRAAHRRSAARPAASARWMVATRLSPLLASPTGRPRSSARTTRSRWASSRLPASLGLRCPTTWPITGWDDIPCARHLHAVADDRAAADARARSARGRAPPTSESRPIEPSHRHEVLPTELVVRSSCGCNAPTNRKEE